MRHLTSFADSQHASLLADYLVSEGVVAHAEQDGDEFAIWVRDEDQLESAKAQLEHFLANPADDRYRAAQPKAAQLRREEAKRQEQARKNQVDIRKQWRANSPGGGGRPIPVTTFTMIICCVLAVMTLVSMPMKLRVHNVLALLLEPGGSAKENVLLRGELWRIWTTQLLHANWLHIAFNMMAFWFLGGQVESRKGGWFLLVFMLVSGAMAIGVEIAAGFALQKYVYPVGMSGIGYGLFGYIWITSRMKPDAGFRLSDENVLIFMAFFVLCWTGLMGPVANWAHTGGLGCGMLWAYLAIQRNTKR